MLSLRTASIAALALLAALVVAPMARGTGTKERVEPASSVIHFDARGSNGWRLQLAAVAAPGKRARGSIGFFARGPHHEEVEYYGAEGLVTGAGVIAAKLPGLGRVSVRFEQTSETPVGFSPGKGCKAEGKSANLKGVFRGTIKFRGEGGYTTVDRQSARGEIELIPRMVCPRPERPKPGAEAEGTGIELLAAGRDLPDGGSLEFNAFGAGLNLPGAGPITDFSATYRHKRGKLTILASTRVIGEEKGLLSLTAPSGTPTEATAEPPAPFTGSATFKLEDPRHGSWTGDLGVEVPTLGTVNLAEPGSWAGACADHCTKTFPAGTQIFFVGIVGFLPGPSSSK